MMQWIVGLDEAGYGPNLGPLVQMAVALRVPDAELDVWAALSNLICRAKPKRGDSRIIFDDSKAVYSGASGFRNLERGWWVANPLVPTELADACASWLGPRDLADLRAEPWFQPQARVPSEIATHELLDWRTRFETGLNEQGMMLGPITGVVVNATRFNAILDQHDSKATVLSNGLIELLQRMIERIPGTEPIHFIIDKQGGRNFYAPFIASAFPDGWVHAQIESASESRYRVSGLARDISLQFAPRADGLHWTVALASMGCKYLREMCMAQFNQWWATHQPGLKPTAGYPVDAIRFRNDIRDTMERLGIEEHTIWRRK